MIQAETPWGTVTFVVHWRPSLFCESHRNQDDGSNDDQEDPVRPD